jgi:hypothetical protein
MIAGQIAKKHLFLVPGAPAFNYALYLICRPALADQPWFKKAAEESPAELTVKDSPI